MTVATLQTDALMRTRVALMILLATAPAAHADEAPEPVANSPWAAVAIFAVVIGMMAAIIIWRRRR
jgi:hypothetical protein